VRHPNLSCGGTTASHASALETKPVAQALPSLGVATFVVAIYPLFGVVKMMPISGEATGWQPVSSTAGLIIVTLRPDNFFLI